MDRKSIFLLVASVLLIFSWQPIMTHFFPPAPVATNMVASATNQLKTNAASTTVTTPNLAAEKVVPINTNAPEQVLSVTNENAIYTFTSHGGGLKQVELVRYPAATQCGAEKNVTTNFYATLNSEAPTAALVLLGGESVQGDGIFELVHTGNVVRAEKSLPNGLSIVKEFTLGTNYLVTAKARLENKGTQTITLPAQEWTIGMAAPMSARDDGTYVGFHFYNGDKAEDVTVRSFAGGGFMGCNTSAAKQY